MSSSLSSQYKDNRGGCLQPLLGFDKSSVRVDTNNTRKTAEDFLASEMSKLSFEERSKALDDLHCVGEELKETPEMIERLLSEFDQVLKQRNAPIYNVAANQDRSYVEDASFRLRFLRANLHDVKQSVNQMISFLSQKEKYFGRDKIARDITLEDLDEEDVEFLLSGAFHIQDCTDQSGRLVVFFLNKNLRRCTLKSMIRANYFIFFNILSPIPAVQSKGVVMCFYDFSTLEMAVRLLALDELSKFMEFSTKVPVRRSALHGCFKPLPGSLVSTNVIVQIMLRRWQRFTRIRCGLHYGSDIELQYTLKGYGINLERFPVDTHGNLWLDILNVWFDKYMNERKLSHVATASSPLARSVPDQDPEAMVQGGGNQIRERSVGKPQSDCGWKDGQGQHAHVTARATSCGVHDWKYWFCARRLCLRLASKSDK